MIIEIGKENLELLIFYKYIFYCCKKGQLQNTDFATAPL